MSGAGYGSVIRLTASQCFISFLCRIVYQALQGVTEEKDLTVVQKILESLGISKGTEENFVILPIVFPEHGGHWSTMPIAVDFDSNEDEFIMHCYSADSSRQKINSDIGGNETYAVTIKEALTLYYPHKKGVLKNIIDVTPYVVQTGRDECGPLTLSAIECFVSEIMSFPKEMKQIAEATKKIKATDAITQREKVEKMIKSRVSSCILDLPVTSKLSEEICTDGGKAGIYYLDKCRYSVKKAQMMFKEIEKPKGIPATMDMTTGTQVFDLRKRMYGSIQRKKFPQTENQNNATQTNSDNEYAYFDEEDTEDDPIIILEVTFENLSGCLPEIIHDQLLQYFVMTDACPITRSQSKLGEVDVPNTGAKILSPTSLLELSKKEQKGSVLNERVSRPLTRSQRNLVGTMNRELITHKSNDPINHQPEVIPTDRRNNPINYQPKGGEGTEEFAAIINFNLLSHKSYSNNGEVVSISLAEAHPGFDKTFDRNQESTMSLISIFDYKSASDQVKNPFV